MKKDKKVVIITGCGSGIGLESAKFLSKSGFLVYAFSRDSSKLEEFRSDSLIPVEVDITKQESIKSAFKDIHRVDVLINNAGYGLVSTVEDVDEKLMLDQFDINVFAVLRMCKVAIPMMREQKSGVIINISSFLGKIGLPLLTLYNSSKYALEGITDSLRYELRDFNIRVHSIMPGFFDTNFARDNLVINQKSFDKSSPYSPLVDKLAPTILDQINSGNDPLEVAKIISQIIEDKNFTARVSAGDKAKKFIPMKRELSDEDFERRVRDYYGLDGLYDG